MKGSCSLLLKAQEQQQYHTDFPSKTPPILFWQAVVRKEGNPSPWGFPLRSTQLRLSFSINVTCNIMNLEKKGSQTIATGHILLSIEDCSHCKKPAAENVIMGTD